MDKKRRLVTKYVTEAFGLLLLTDTLNTEESLLVRKAPWVVSYSACETVS